MPLPALTLSDASSVLEMWNMFWEATAYFNAGIPYTDMNFGTEGDTLSSSKNLKPYKIRFGPFGHSHDLATGVSISPTNFRKRHFDLNSAHVLWASLWDYDRGGFDPNHLVCVAGKVDITLSGGSGTAQLTKFPGDASSTLDIDTAGKAWRDSDPTHWDAGSKEWLGAIVSIGEPITVTPATERKTLFLYDNGSGSKFVKLIMAGTFVITINYMVFLRYTWTPLV